MKLNKLLRRIKWFMLQAGQPVPTSLIESRAISPAQRKLRISLIAEELQEYAEANGYRIQMIDGKLSLIDLHLEPDTIKSIDGLCDLNFVVNGGFVDLGITDVDPYMIEVCDSNDTKFIDGYRNKETGKWMKGLSYRPADLKKYYDLQKIYEILGLKKS